jgi:hypothetical protein
MPLVTRGHRICSTATVLVLLSLVLDGCGGAGGGGGDWYYHWSCNGDYECLTTNPTGQASGTVDEGPVQVNCTQLMQFAAHFWGSAATNSCDQSPGGATTQRTLRSIAVSPQTTSIPKGLTAQFTATGTYTDGTTGDVSSTATWTTSNTSVAHMMGSQAFGDAVGTTAVTAAIGSISGTAQLTVTPAVLQSVTVTPTNPTVVKTLTLGLTATGSYSDGTSQDLTASASWSSASPGVATVTAGGVVTGVAVGSSRVTAAYGGKSGSTNVTVGAATLQSIVVTPAAPTQPVGIGQQFTATGTYSDGTAHDVTAAVTWTSGTPAVATIATGGLATGVTAGTSTITATSGAVSASTPFTVTAAVLESIQVTPASATVTPGFSQPFSATGQYSDGSLVALSASATWSSSATAVATVVAGGTATGVSSGTATITATYAGIAGSATLTVTSGVLQSIYVSPNGYGTTVGGTVQYSATGYYSDGSNHPVAASWSSDAPSVATVSGSGLATALGAGSANILASVGNISGSGILTVLPPGILWTAQVSGTAVNPLYAVASSGARWVAVGPGTIEISSDGASWSGEATASTDFLLGVTWTGSSFVAIGMDNANGHPLALRSPDGLTWTAAEWTPAQTTQPRAIGWTGNQLVAVGLGGISTSPDGVTWTARTSGTSSLLYGVAASPSLAVVVGANGTILTSPDGVTWTTRASGTSAGLYGVTWSGAQFVAVGDAGTVVTSPNGTTWTVRSAGTAAGLASVAWSGTEYVAVGSGGAVLYSPDAASWSAATSGTTLDLYSVAYSGRQFVTVGGPQHAIVLSSP